jgi:hypothetical protein
MPKLLSALIMIFGLVCCLIALGHIVFGELLSMRLTGRRVGVGGVPLAQAAAMVSLRAAIWLPVGKVPVVARAVAMDSLRAAVWSRAAISLCHSSADTAIPGTSIKS